MPRPPADPPAARRSRALGQAPARTVQAPGVPVEVRRSKRRRKTVSAYRDGDRIIVLLPARMTRAEEAHWVEVMTERLAERDRRHRRSDADLLAKARALSAQYLGGRAVPASVRWVTNQGSRWGSCTIEDATIRLSARLQTMPPYVIDYVLLHELAHLLVPDHGPGFWALLEGHPRTERARGFLDGWSGAKDGWAGSEVDGTDEAESDGIDQAESDGSESVDSESVDSESVDSERDGVEPGALF